MTALQYAIVSAIERVSCLNVKLLLLSFSRPYYFYFYYTLNVIYFLPYVVNI